MVYGRVGREATLAAPRTTGTVAICVIQVRVLARKPTIVSSEYGSRRAG